jgi:hypothetical protein
MNRQPHRPWSVDLDALPDPLHARPLPGVRVDASFFQHVLARHSAQPLGEVFGDQAFRRLRKRADEEAFRDAVVPLVKELRSGLAVGLTMAFDARDARGRLTTTYLVVLPCGALAALRLGQGVSLRTVYFTDRSLRRHGVEARRGASAATLVNRYAVRSEEFAAYVPPPPTFGRKFTSVQTGRSQVRTNVRFHDPARWGFRPDLVGCPYRGRPDVRFAA